MPKKNKPVFRPDVLQELRARRTVKAVVEDFRELWGATLHPRTWSRWEAGETTPRGVDLFMICSYFGVTVQRLYAPKKVRRTRK